MRHKTISQRLSRPSEQRAALVNGLVKSLVVHGQVRTTHARAKEAQRLAERLVTLGKNGSIHARRRAFRVLQDRGLVKRLFAEIAPKFMDSHGGCTRVVRLSNRAGDGAQTAILTFSRLTLSQAAPLAGAKPAQGPQQAPVEPVRSQPKKEKTDKPKGFFDGLRGLWSRKKGGQQHSN